MTNGSTGYFVLAGAFIVILIERLSVWWIQPELVSQINFLDWVGAVSIILIVVTSIDKPEIMEGIVGEYDSLKDVLFALGVVGIVAGMGFLFLSVGQGNTVEESAQNSIIGGLTASITGGEYTPLNMYLANPSYGNGETREGIVQFSQTRFDAIGGDVSSFQAFLLSFNLNFFHVGLNEELAMLAFTALILAGFGLTFKADSGMELLNPFAQITLLIRGFAFGILHIFAYTNGLESFSVGYFIPAIIGGIFFGALAYWKGLLPAVMAHAVYNTGIDFVFATGWTFIVAQFGIIFMVIGGVYIVWDLVIKEQFGIE